MADTVTIGDVLRVFPRRTNLTPDDDFVWIGAPGLIRPNVNEVHVSILFTWDCEQGKELANSWSDLGYPVKLGGPAFNARGDNFVPGFYIKHGAVITSRGCPNRCWFCYVPKREGVLRELPITEGWNILDDNLLACSRKHIEAVFNMLEQQKRRPDFTGGLDAELMEPWIAENLVSLKPRTLYFACDAPDDLPYVLSARQMMLDAGYSPRSHAMCCYVLIGYPRDTMEEAEKRLKSIRDAGITPYAMLYRDNSGKRDMKWAKFQKYWLRPHAVWGQSPGIPAKYSKQETRQTKLW